MDLARDAEIGGGTVNPEFRGIKRIQQACVNCRYVFSLGAKGC